MKLLPFKNIFRVGCQNLPNRPFSQMHSAFHSLYNYKINPARTANKNINMITLSKRLRNELWWMVISVDYDYSRITIADHEFNGDTLTLWLEDKHDYKNKLDECLQIDINEKQLAKFIKVENFNSYIGSKMHPIKKYLFKTRIAVNEPIAWYMNDAGPHEQQWVRDALVKRILTQLIENEAREYDMY